MKYLAALACLLLTTIAVPAFAHGHEKEDLCSTKAEKIDNPTERTEFLKSCMAKEAAPEEVAKHAEHDKKEHCDMNAKGMKLEGKKKAEYLEHCYHESDFKKEQKPHPKM